MTLTGSHQEKLNRFRLSGEENYIFACHAALPLVITPDLLYQLWNNFKQYQYADEPLETCRISHIAISDLLLSNLCREVGVELYEFEKEIRDLLLSDLVINIGEKRKNSVAKFLEDYAAVDFRYSHRKNLKDIHLLTAQSILDPAFVERQLVKRINEAVDDREKLQYLVLHHNLIPIGYDSDLSKISREAAKGNETGNVSPILISEENDQAPGVLKITLPDFLKNKIHSVPKAEIINISAEASIAADSMFASEEKTALPETTDDIEQKIIEAKRTNKLDLSNHQLTYIPDAVFDIFGLVELDVSFNQISSLADQWSRLPHLQVIRLSHNMISELPPSLVRLNQVRILDVSYTYLLELPVDIYLLTNLENFNLSNTEISVLPFSLAQCARLQDLKAEGCGIINLPPEMLQGDPNISASFKSYVQEITIAKQSDPGLLFFKQGDSSLLVTIEALLHEEDTSNSVYRIYENITRPYELFLVLSSYNKTGCFIYVDDHSGTFMEMFKNKEDEITRFFKVLNYSKPLFLFYDGLLNDSYVWPLLQQTQGIGGIITIDGEVSQKEKFAVAFFRSLLRFNSLQDSFDYANSLMKTFSSSISSVPKLLKGESFFDYRLNRSNRLTAFVSSTYEDLREHRAYVIARLKDYGITVNTTEYWTPASIEPDLYLPDQVKGCDLFILLVAFRRGIILKGEKLSIPQLEYREAIKSGMDIFVFLSNDEARWPAEFFELNKDPELRQWRNKLMEQHIVGSFGANPESIQIAPALASWMLNRTRAAHAEDPIPMEEEIGPIKPASDDPVKPVLIRDKATSSAVFRIIESAYKTQNKKLNLRGNSIKTIPKELESLATQLEELILADNLLEDISALAACTELRHLSLAKNKIVDISPLIALTKLEYLSLNRNLVEEIRPLSNMLQLRKLYLSTNNIRSTPAVMRLLDLPVINHLSLWNNKIDQVPHSSLGDNNTDNCLPSLRDYRNSGSNVNEPLRIYVMCASTDEAIYQKLMADLLATFPGLIMNTRNSNLTGGLSLELISDQITQSDYVLLIATSEAGASPTFWHEFEIAKLNEHNNNAKKIVRLSIDDSTLPSIMEIYSPIDFLQDYEAGFVSLLQVLQAKNKSPDVIAQPAHFMYFRFQDSDSAFAKKLTSSLSDYGFTIKDWKSIRGGLDQGTKISIRYSHYLFIILSQASAKSKDLQTDVDYCLKHHVKCTIILKDNCQVPASMQALPTISFESSYRKGLDTFVRTYGYTLQVAEKKDGPKQGFLDKEHLDKQLSKSKLFTRGESVKEHLLIFSSHRQKAWLSFSNRNIFYLLDDLSEKNAGKLVRWKLSLTVVKNNMRTHGVLIRPPSKEDQAAGNFKLDVGLLDMGTKKNLEYSVDLFKSPNLLIDRIHACIENATGPATKNKPETNFRESEESASE